MKNQITNKGLILILNFQHKDRVYKCVISYTLKFLEHIQLIMFELITELAVENSDNNGIQNYVCLNVFLKKLQ